MRRRPSVNSSPRPRALAREVRSYGMLGILASGSWLSLQCTAQTQSISEPIRRLDTRFSEEIGVQAPIIFVPETLGPINPSAPVSTQSSRGLYATIGLTREYDDNVLRQDNQTVGDDRLIINPSIGYDGEFGRHTYKLNYAGTYISYRSLNSENNRSHVFSGSAQLALTKILKGEIRASYNMGTEARGETTGRLTQSAVPDAFRSTAAGVTLTLGRRIAKAQIEAKFDHAARRYTNNGQQGRNLDTHEFGVRGYYNFGPKLSAFVEVGRAFLDYRDPNSTLGGDTLSILGGVRWEATARTSGELKIGRERRSFDEQLDSAFGYTWDVNVRWEPQANSVVEVFTSQSIGESASTASNSGTQTNASYGFSWVYGFSDRFTATNQVQFSTTEFGTARSDETVQSSHALNYEFDPGIAISAKVSRSVRESSDSSATFKDNTYSVQFKADYSRFSDF